MSTGYGDNKYFAKVIEILGEEYRDSLAAIWGSAETARDMKINNFLTIKLMDIQMRMLRELQVLNDSLATKLAVDMSKPGKSVTVAAPVLKKVEMPVPEPKKVVS